MKCQRLTLRNTSVPITCDRNLYSEKGNHCHLIKSFISTHLNDFKLWIQWRVHNFYHLFHQLNPESNFYPFFTIDIIDISYSEEWLHRVKLLTKGLLQGFRVDLIWIILWVWSALMSTGVGILFENLSSSQQIIIERIFFLGGGDNDELPCKENGFILETKAVWNLFIKKDAFWIYPMA